LNILEATCEEARPWLLKRPEITELKPVRHKVSWLDMLIKPKNIPPAGL
jgi:hypothetical protein